MKTRTEKLLEKRDIQLSQAEQEIDRLSRNIRKQSIILNSIRELLLTKTEWNGTFGKGEDLSHIIAKNLKRRGETCPPSDQ